MSRRVEIAVVIPAGYSASRMTGRCANGAERDGGRVWHAVAVDAHAWAPALCGTTPGRRFGNGWSEQHGGRVTCARCLRRAQHVAPPTHSPADRDNG